jgi:hypothetical protein
LLLVYSRDGGSYIALKASQFHCETGPCKTTIPPHQQLMHEALFNKIDLCRIFSQKNNG